MTTTINPAEYGVQETNPLEMDVREWQNHLHTFATESVAWDDPALARITRLRLLSEPGFPVWDVSYCHGVLRDGTNVRVQVPFDQLRKGRHISEIITWAKRDGVYAKGLGIFEVISTLQ